MAVRDFAIVLIDELLKDKELALTDQDIRFYDKGTTAETDEDLDDHIRWKNARYFNEESNVVRSSLLIIQMSFENGSEHVSFHMGELYRIYRKGGMKEVLPIVKRDIKDLKSSAVQSLALINKFSNYEAVKEHLIIRPLNYDDNEKALAKGIYRRVGDMALVLYISLGNMAQGATQNILSTMVSQDIFQIWGVDEKEVFNWALENTMRLQPPVLCQIIRGIGSQLQQKHVHFMKDESVTFNFDNPLAPALTTEQEVNGAIAAFYPGVLERLYQMVSGDFYLMFTSIYDVHINPVDGHFKTSAMRATIADTNRDMNQRGELLTRQLYRYNGDTKEITVA